MLVELQIRDFAIIDTVVVPFAEGMNVLTGETGAGKSILIDALGAVLGERVSSDVVRTGKNSARVDVVFDLRRFEPEARARLDALLADYGLDAEDDTLILSREIQLSGRSTARVGGRQLPVSALQRVAELLVDIHGQSEHLSLLRLAEQTNLLDRYAGTGSLRARVAEVVERLRKTRRELAAISASERDQARRLDLLQHQVNEIEIAQLQPGEDADLAAEQRVLSSAERLAALADDAYEALTDARDRVARAGQALKLIAAIDPAGESAAQTASDSLDVLEDLARDARRYRDGIEFNPERLAEVVERLELIQTLKRKYGATLEEVMEFGRRASAELSMITSSAERRERLQSEDRALRAQLADLATQLSSARALAAQRLATEVETELADLGLARATFHVALRRSADMDGLHLPEHDSPIAFDETGIDRVEFLLAANPGDAPKPIGKVASGGEMARIMLALKSVLGRLDHVGTLVFDEVDVGIGGRTGNIVGQKLWGLATSHQVICITHLPQVASFADTHLSVVKLQDQNRTTVSVRALDADGRRVEIAQMLGGATATTERSAAELLERAQDWKTNAGATSPAGSHP